MTRISTEPAMTRPPRRPDPPLLQASQLSKQFPGVAALDEVDFDLRSGEVHILFGENGAGKSTLIQTLAGSSPTQRRDNPVPGRAGNPRIRAQCPRARHKCSVPGVFARSNTNGRGEPFSWSGADTPRRAEQEDDAPTCAEDPGGVGLQSRSRSSRSGSEPGRTADARNRQSISY